MSGMLSSAAVVLSQNTPLWGCSYMQRHLSGQQRGRTCLWSPLCHLWPGSWPWNSLWYTERPGKQQMKATLIKRVGRAASKEYTKTLLVNVLLIFLIIHGHSGSQRILSVTSVLRLLSGCPPHPQPTNSSTYRLARGQPSGRKGIPSTVRAAVFVLPNSIPFHSLSAHSVYFGAPLHRGAWLSWRRKTSPWLPIRWHDRWKQLSPAQRKRDKGDNITLQMTLRTENDRRNDVNILFNGKLTPKSNKWNR